MSKAAELAALIGSQTAQSNRNLVINGAMNIAQRGTSSTDVGASNGVFPCVDRIKIFAGNTAGRATVSQVADVHDGFANALKFECTTADTSISASENFGLLYIFEGQDLQQLKKGTSDAKSLTLSFYVKGNASATYTVEMKDNDNDRNNTQTFNVTTSWNRVSLTIVPDTTGALDDDNASSFQIGIWLHAGSTYNSGTFTSNTWAAKVNANRVSSSATSFFDSTDRTFFITGVQLEVGEQATPFEHRSFGDELARCQRYYQMQVSGTGVAPNTTACDFNIQLQTSMRDSPTISSQDGEMQITNVTAADFNSSSLSVTGAASRSGGDGLYQGGRIRLSGFSGLTAGDDYIIDVNTDNSGKITYDAEL